MVQEIPTSGSQNQNYLEVNSSFSDSMFYIPCLRIPSMPLEDVINFWFEINILDIEESHLPIFKRPFRQEFL